MKKYFICTLCGLLFLSVGLIAQSTVISPASILKATVNKDYIIKEDKADVVEITGIGNSAFATSSTFNGTQDSYKYSLKISLSLLTASASKETYQLVFYSPTEASLPFATSLEAGVTNVYYPISLYEAIKLKLDQSLAAKKKVQLKVTLRTDGFREAVLIL